MKTLYIITWCSISFGITQLSFTGKQNKDGSYEYKDLTRNDTFCDGVAHCFTDTARLNYIYRFVKKQSTICNIQIDTIQK